MSDSTRYRIKTRGGRIVVGVVQGSGGFLRGEDGLKRLRAAAKGKTPSFYVPSPGMIRVYPHFSALTNGAPADVPFTGSTFAISKAKPKKSLFAKLSAKAKTASAHAFKHRNVKNHVKASTSHYLAELQAEKEGLSEERKHHHQAAANHTNEAFAIREADRLKVSGGSKTGKTTAKEAELLRGMGIK